MIIEVVGGLEVKGMLGADGVRSMPWLGEGFGSPLVHLCVIFSICQTFLDCQSTEHAAHGLAMALKLPGPEPAETLEGHEGAVLALRLGVAGAELRP